MKTQSFTSIEPLESRIAPAAVVTFTDIDGDLVKITASKGPLDAADLTFVGGGAGGQLSKLNLTDAGFQGADVKITVTKKPGGDGKAHVGFFDATGRDLGTVVIPGDLSFLVAGDSDNATTGLKSLSVESIGRFGLHSGPTLTGLGMDVVGKLGSLKVKKDLYFGRIFVDGDANGRLDSLSIGGSIIGGGSAASGLVFAEGEIGNVVVQNILGGTGVDSGAVFSSVGIKNVTVSGNIVGGAGNRSGYIATAGVIGGKVFVGGDVIGGTGENSGAISAGAILSVQIAGSLIGAGGRSSGSIQATGDLFNVSIAGNLIGSSGQESGLVNVGGRVLKGSVGFDIFGGSISGSQSNTYTGAILAGSLGTFTVGGSIFAGHDTSTGSFLVSGGIISRTEIGTITIKGAVIGTSSTSAFILANGASAPTATSDVAIGKLVIGGRAENALIGAGYSLETGLISNGNAQIGSVTVGGDWITSSIFAGVRDVDGNGFGGADDLVASNAATGPVASIASIMIKGDVIGSIVPSATTFGFVAQQIGKFKAGNAAPVLTSGTDAAVTLNPITRDIFLREI